jgi:hypothetical protein
VENGCFAEGVACAAGEETTLDPGDDEAVIFEDFFVPGLRMPPHPVPADILLMFQAQLYHLTPNVMAQLSKYFCTISIFGGFLTVDAFAKRYELHYQLKRVQIGEDVVYAQFGCLNSHVKRYKDSGPKLSLAMKNKSSTGWSKAWLNYRVRVDRRSEGGKSIYTLHSRMSAL